MGWANRITVLRGVLTAAVIVVLLVDAPDPRPAVWWTAFVLFALTAATDAVDGALARRLQEVSVFGRIADPLVDKLLVLGTATVVLPLDGMASVLPAWAVVIMLAREVLVTALRGAVEGKGVSFQAVWLGKWKMLLQCVAVGAVLLYGAGVGFVRAPLPGLAAPFNIAYVLVWAAVLLTAWSGVDYGRRAAPLLRRG